MSLIISDEHFNDPYLTYHSLINNDGIHWSSQFDAWLVFDFTLIKKLLEGDLLSSKKNKLSKIEGSAINFPLLNNFYNHWLMYNDDPIHGEMRSWAVKLLKEQQANIELVTFNTCLIDAVNKLQSESSSFEFVEKYSKNIASIVLSKLYKCESNKINTLLGETENIVDLLGSMKITKELLISADLSLKKVFVFIEQIVDIEELKRMTTFDWEDILSLLGNILLDGYKSLHTLISNVSYNILLNDLKNTELVIGEFTKSVEEFIRYDPPFQYISRTVKADISLNGNEIKGGQKMMLFIAAANRCPCASINPRLLDYESTGSTDHLSFGYGKHYCIGASIVRQTLRSILNPLLNELHKFQLVKPVVWQQSYGYRAFNTMELARK